MQSCPCRRFFLGWWAATDAPGIAERDLDIPPDIPQSIELMKKRGRNFCESFTEINASLHKNALFFDDKFIRQVIEAYDPFFKLILNVDYNSLPKLPEQYKDVVAAGRVPRQIVIELFRKSLGVFQDDQ